MNSHVKDHFVPGHNITPLPGGTNLDTHLPSSPMGIPTTKLKRLNCTDLQFLPRFCLTKVMLMLPNACCWYIHEKIKIYLFITSPQHIQSYIYSIVTRGPGRIGSRSLFRRGSLYHCASSSLGRASGPAPALEIGTQAVNLSPLSPSYVSWHWSSLIHGQHGPLKLPLR